MSSKPIRGVCVILPIYIYIYIYIRSLSLAWEFSHTQFEGHVQAYRMWTETVAAVHKFVLKTLDSLYFL